MGIWDCSRSGWNRDSEASLLNWKHSWVLSRQVASLMSANGLNCTRVDWILVSPTAGNKK